MKRLFACALVLMLPLFSGCEQRLFHFVVTVDRTVPFQFDDADGTFDGSAVITRDDVLNALDIPKSARITSVDIESLALRVAVKPENQARSLTVSGEVYDVVQDKAKMFDNYPIVLAGANVPYVGLNSLIESGITKLRNKIEGFVKQLDSTSFFVEVSGQSVPAGSAVAVELTLQIKATVKYDECLDVPLGASGEDCPEKDIVSP